MIAQHVTYGAGGTIYFYPREALTTPTVTIRTNRNADMVTAASATASTISTTLASAASAGATTISVAGATGIATGAILNIAGDTEEAIVKSISGTTVTLRRPLLVDHTYTSVVKCFTLSYTVPAASANVLFFDGRAILYSAGVYYMQIPVECTRYPLFRLATLQDIWDEHPQLRDILSNNDDPERLLNLAHNDVMTQIEAIDRSRCFMASGAELARAVTYQFLSNYYRHQASESGSALYDRYKSEAIEEIKRVASVLPRDPNMNESIQPGEKMSFNSMRVRR